MPCVYGYIISRGTLSHVLVLIFCLEIPLADTGSLTTGPSVDNQAGFEVGRLRKPTWRICTSAYLKGIRQILIENVSSLSRSHYCILDATRRNPRPAIRNIHALDTRSDDARSHDTRTREQLRRLPFRAARKEGTIEDAHLPCGFKGTRLARSADYVDGEFLPPE